MILFLAIVLNQNFQETDIHTNLTFCIYLFRFIFIIFILNLIYTILSINGEKLNVIPLILIGFVFLIFIDLYCGSSLITYSSNTSCELIYVILEVAIMTGIYLFIQKKFINKEDLFND